MIERIEVHAGQERGKPDVFLIGALAQILAFIHQKTTTASCAGDGGRVLMVAGDLASSFGVAESPPAKAAKQCRLTQVRRF